MLSKPARLEDLFLALSLSHQKPSFVPPWHKNTPSLSKKKPPAMSLLSLPNELLILSAEHLNQTDTSSLLLTNRRFALLLAARLSALATQDRGVWTALQWAASKGSQSLALAVLKTGADVNFLFPDDVRERVHKTALQLAAEAADEAMVRLLLSHGADVSIYSRRGATRIHYAVKSRSRDIVVLLLQHGAPIYAANRRLRG